jgi:hypothetical protein
MSFFRRKTTAGVFLDTQLRFCAAQRLRCAAPNGQRDIGAAAVGRRLQCYDHAQQL